MSESAEQAAPESTFDTRMQERLQAEYGEVVEAPKGEAEPVEDSALDTETPENTAESEDEADGALSVDETEEEDSALDDETPDDDDAEVVNWELRYNDQQSELTKLQMSRKDDESEHASAMASNLSVQHELEDLMEKQEQQGRFLAEAMTANANQFRNIDWSRVPQDQVQAVQQKAHQAFAQEQQVQGAYNQMLETQNAERDKGMKRQAAIARQRLTRSIPDFDKAYPEIGSYAVSRGMNADAFNKITDPALIEMINDSMSLHNAPETVKPKNQPRAKAPKSRITPDKPRNAQGKLRKADEAFRNERNPKARLTKWEARKQQQLDMERKG